MHTEHHPGAFDVVVIRDTSGNSFSTRKDNVFVAGRADGAAVSLPKGQGIKLTILEERDVVAKKRKTAGAV
jgi:small subunit ribosomal protein S4e